MEPLNLKTKEEIAIMAEGGKKLAKIKAEVKKAVKEGVSAAEIEELTTTLINKSGAKPSFKMVPGYSWSTCININEGVVHGIPHKKIVFKNGDIVSVDMGLFYKGFHSDTSFSVLIGEDKEKQNFLKVGKEALARAIKAAKPGNAIWDISKAMEDTLVEHNLSPIRALVGHGIGHKLHEDPSVPCIAYGSKNTSQKLSEGLTIAIEVMYAQGKPDLVKDSDGWTLRTKDATITALFEDTVAITKEGPLVLTE